MRKIFTVLFVLILFIQPYAQTQNKALIFSIDISKSILQPPGFYQQLKENIKNYIRNDVKVNDLVTIYSFGNDVSIVTDIVNFKVSGTQDIEKLIQFIDRINPSDNKTFLTKAVDIVADQIVKLQRDYSELSIKAYIFTDGKNDPPTGVSSLTFEQILEKHRVTFNNDKTWTYIYTFDSNLDPGLKTIVDSTDVELKPGTKDIQNRSVFFSKNFKILKKNIGGSDTIRAFFKYDQINNIKNGKIKFSKVAGEIGDFIVDEFSFEGKSTGTSFVLPIRINKGIKSGKHKLKFITSSVGDKFEISPKEEIIEIEIEAGYVELFDDLKIIEATKEGGKVQFDLSGNNKSSSKVKVLPVLNPDDNILKYEGEPIILPQGKFKVDFELTIAPTDLGETQYEILLQPIEMEIRVEKSIPLTLKIVEPFNWGPILTIILILLILGLLGGLGYLYFYLVDKEFAKFTISGIRLDKEPLNEFKKFWQTKIIVGKNIFSDAIGEEIFTIKADLLTPFKKELKLEWSQVHKDRILPNNVLSCNILKPIIFQFDKKYHIQVEKTNN